LGEPAQLIAVRKTPWHAFEDFFQYIEACCFQLIAKLTGGYENAVVAIRVVFVYKAVQEMPGSGFDADVADSQSSARFEQARPFPVDG
jgi:hypothetical protein